MSRTTRRTLRVSALLLAGALALTACSGETQTSGEPATPTADTTQPAPEPKTWPLTGENAGRLPKRRAVVVKIENTDSSDPQRGLGSADLVVEELVEGGLTRLAAFYYSSMPAQVGPVRSLRGTDIAVVKPANAVLVASGGAPKVMQRTRRADVVTAPEGTAGYYRVDNRPSPYNLFVNLQKLPKDKLSGPRPSDYLPWGTAKSLRGGKPAKHVTVQFSGGTSTEWTWNGRGWRRGDSHAAQGDDFRPDNVLALRVKQVDAGYSDAAGNPVPESVLTGRGAATLFHQGRAHRGTWVKKAPGRPLRLVTAGGKKMPVPPGHTWVELVPSSGGGLQFGR